MERQYLGSKEEPGDPDFDVIVTNDPVEAFAWLIR